MITAEVTFSRTNLIGIKHPMAYPGIDWQTYEDISEELGESSSLHVTYHKGTLTFMPVTELHEMLVSLLHSFVTFTGMYLRTNIVSTGTATLRSRLRLIGVEPDLSYFVKSADGHMIKSHVDNEIRFPPDIVAEIDVFHTSDDKFDIYSELGIPEFWRYLDGEFQIFLLRDGKYAEAEKSEQLPVLTSKILGEFLNRGQQEQQFKVLTDFQSWLQDRK